MYTQFFIVFANDLGSAEPTPRLPKLTRYIYIDIGIYIGGLSRRQVSIPPNTSQSGHWERQKNFCLVFVYWGVTVSHHNSYTWTAGLERICSVQSPDVLQCSEPRSRLDTSSRLGAPLSREMKEQQNHELAWPRHCSWYFFGPQRSWATSKWFLNRARHLSNFEILSSLRNFISQLPRQKNDRAFFDEEENPPQVDYFDLDTEQWSPPEDSDPATGTQYLGLLVEREAIYRWGPQSVYIYTKHGFEMNPKLVCETVSSNALKMYFPRAGKLRDELANEEKIDLFCSLQLLYVTLACFV